MNLREPLHSQLFDLPFKGVQVECLDERKNSLRGAVASGFLRKEGGILYLYTAWHVVTGFDPHHISVGYTLPERRYLRVSFQDAQSPQTGIEAIGGIQSIVVPLYENPSASVGPLEPLWEQNDDHIAHPLLNHVGIFVPFWNDIVRIALPAFIRTSEIQLVADERLMRGNGALVAVGEKCLIVGYPYGFSAAIGFEQPTPVVFTRFIAGVPLASRRRSEFLLDGYGAPGMSGGPVFLERDDQLLLLGVYTGDIFPDHEYGKSEKSTALGTVSDLRLYLKGAIAMTKRPSRPN